MRNFRADCAVGCMVPYTLPYDETCQPYCDAFFRDLMEVKKWICE